MTFKEYGESAEIEYITEVYVNGESIGQISNYSQESHLEDFRKLDHAINQALTEQYEALPESAEV